MVLLEKRLSSNAHMERESKTQLREQPSYQSKSQISDAKTPSSGSKRELSQSKSQTSSTNYSLDELLNQVAEFTTGYRRAGRQTVLEPINVRELMKFALQRPDKEFYSAFFKKRRPISSSENMAEAEKRSLEERERLMAPVIPKHTGFKPRSIQQLTKRKPPRSMLNIECAHLLRCGNQETAHGHEPVMYTMWKEAGKHEPPFPDRPDPNYNSNVWRNFRKSYGFHTDVEGQNINEMIAQLYPVNLPPPSRVGAYSYPRFLTETPLIKDERLRRIAIERTTKDILEFKRVRLRSEARNPPLDERGNIAPPVNFKKHAHRFIPPDDTAGRPPSPQPDTKIDMFGKQVPVLKNKTREPFMWKMSYRLNNPQYQKVQEERERKKEVQPQHPPAMMVPARGKVQ